MNSELVNRNKTELIMRIRNLFSFVCLFFLFACLFPLINNELTESTFLHVSDKLVIARLRRTISPIFS